MNTAPDNVHIRGFDHYFKTCTSEVDGRATGGCSIFVKKGFCNKRKLHPDPTLTIYNSHLPVVSQTKFLGVIFDSKLNFKAHIDYIRQKCEKAMNLLKVVAKMDWGADRSVLMKFYRSFVRSRLEYGCAVFSSAHKSYLKKLEPIQNQGLRVCLGAFRTSPMQSLHVEAKESPLYLRFDVSYVFNML